MKHIFIVNPKSGKADARVYLEPKLCDAARAAGVDFDVVHTEYAGHAAQYARQYAEAGEPVRLYACGGDGTLNEVFAGACGHANAEVASVPCGSGNDFVRNFGTSENFLDLADNVAGTAVPIDLVRTDMGISAAICSVGLDADVAYRIPHFRRIPLCGGSMAYNLAIVESLLRPLGHRLRVQADDTVYEDDFLIVAVCNGVAYGGGFRAAPTADVQDGLREVVLVKKLSRLRLTSLLALYKAGKHIENGVVIPQLQGVMTYIQAKKVTITPLGTKPVVVNVDGECSKRPGLHLEVLPGAARFVLPAALAARAKTPAAVEA